ncbi:glycosyltransferase 87 family protein [Pseudonocardia xinjiangensis]|uniref:glycosyltransferase 87 family protein n=1 Tax=Pseudonocardia xinjiangensis TaxID=75289 RepID=UPI003D8C6577
MGAGLMGAGRTTADTEVRGRRALRWGTAGAVVALVGQAVVLALWPAAHLLMIDLQVYRAGGEHVLSGEPLYTGGVLLDLPFVYPPFAAALFAPLVFLPLDVLKVLWTVGGLALLGYVVHRCARSVGVPSGSAAVATVLLTVLATCLDPVRTTLYLGQINIVLLALVVADLLGRPGSRWRGVGLGIAAAVKLTPLIFVVYLLVTGRRRAAATALGVFVVAAGIGFLAAPSDSVAYWFHGTFAAAGRISDVAGNANHSLNGLLARFGTPSVPSVLPWILTAAVLGALTVWLAVRAHRGGQEVLALTLCGLGSAALAPFAWSHHWVWVVPLVVLLAHRAVTGGRAATVALLGVLAATLAVVTALPGPGVGPIPSTGLISLQPDVYLLLFLAVLAGSWWWLGSPVPWRTGGQAERAPGRPGT